MEKNNFWSVESYRLTAFYSSRDINKSFFKELFSEDPDRTSYQKNLGIFQEEGSLESFKLIVIQGNQRVDIIFLPKDDALVNDDSDNFDFSFKTLGSLSDSLDIFKDISADFIKNQNNVIRLAFGCVLIHKEDSKQKAYEEISKLIDLKLDSEIDSDLMFQINKPRVSKKEANILINCITKWAVVTSFSKILMITPEENEILKSNNNNFACRLELDINSKQTGLIDFSKKSNVLFNEFLDILKEISNKGL